MTRIIGQGRSRVHSGRHIGETRIRSGGTYTGDHKGGISEVVELVDAGEKDGPKDSKEPSA